MQSRKTLYIILIVGLAIFVISLAIGRPWWQALLFTIAFLLITAVLSSSGLVIPEGLFGMNPFERRFSRKSPEAINKAEFLEGMESALADLSVQPEAKIEDIVWMTEYTRVMKSVVELVYNVHDSVLSKNKAEQSRAFKEAVKQLSHLISEFKNIPEPITPKMLKTMKRQSRGIDLYLLACSNFAEALETSNGELAGLAAKQINDALNLLDILDKSQLVQGK